MLSKELNGETGVKQVLDTFEQFSEEEHERLDVLLQASIEECTVEITKESEPELFNFVRDLYNRR